ncbi:MAG TPA: nucleotidyltransferase [Hyphomonadaceae bacterium]|jgi:Uncharacterized conserved protein|nr:nucleotidyltransferase [Hyphomonadaceae bacterium]
MSDREWRALVEDMIDYAKHARAHAAGMNEIAFAEDLKTLHAVTRCVEIIGEAARAVPDDIREQAPSVPWAKIVATRNILAHAYGRVDATILWRLVDQGLHVMIKDLEILLAQQQ